MPAKSKKPVNKVVVLPPIIVVALVCFASTVVKAVVAVATLAVGYLLVAAFVVKSRRMDAKSSIIHWGHAHRQELVSDRWTEH